MASNTSPLDTDLSLPPYFDDYDPTKQYYRVLFKPSTAIQARELNELQSILQNQVQSFGQNIFKEGSVIKGCTFTFDNNYNYVKLQDSYANGISLNVSDLVGYTVWNNNGLNAVVVNYQTGFVSNDPDLNTIYLKYLNTGVYPNNTPQKFFDPNETLIFTNATSNAIFGNVVTANVANTTGVGYAMTVTDGIIFKKGFFIYVTPQTIVIDKYDNVPDSISVGFDAPESLINSNIDTNLLDNAQGSTNENAPGADRLKLSPNLVVRPTSQANTSGFFSVADFRFGVPVTIRQDTQFNSIAKTEAQRTFETNGNFVVSPFNISTQSLANTSDPDYSTHFNAIVSKGLGYVEGYRVEYLNNNAIKVRRGTDTNTILGQITSLNYGYYTLVNELCGTFESPNSIIQVELHNVAKQAITNNSYLGTGFSSTTKIGTAYVRSVVFDNGSPGDNTAQYRLYLFNISLIGGANFSQVKSIIYNNSGMQGVADVVLTYNLTSNANIATIYNTGLYGMIFDLGQTSLKSDGFNHTSFIYERLSNTQILTSGNSTVSIPTAIGTGSETSYFTGAFSSPEMNLLTVTPTQNGFTPNKTGTITVNSVNTSVIGVASSFFSDYYPGDIIFTNSTYRKIVSISNNTFLTVNSPFGSNAGGITHSKAFPAGVPIPYGTRPARSMYASGNTITLSLGESANAAFNVQVLYPILRQNTVSIKKNLNPLVFVKIDCSNNAGGIAGPWSLGVPDVYKIDGIYLDTTGNKTYTNTGINYLSQFTVSNGQRSSYYDLASISNPSGVTITPTTTILVQLRAFTYDTSQGLGFFTANSYPIDDVNISNTYSIMTKDVPTFTASDGTYYDLRNCVDFRPYGSNTAVIANTIIGATVNPSSTLAFNQTPYIAAPDSPFISDITYYMGRTDRLSVDINGYLINDEGIASSGATTAPLERTRTMTLATLYVPPYPSLTTNEARTYNRYDLAVTTQSSQIRRYTMKDIGVLDKRIATLEYYTSLSLLESSASTLQVRSTATGQTRFQNGIFVDPFNGFDLSNTKHPMFYIAIDPIRTELRPSFVQVRSEFNFDQSLSNNVVQSGKLVLLNHTSNTLYISQGYASKYRNCIDGNIYTWVGTITFDPPGQLAPDITQSPAVINNIDLAQNWINLQNAWGTQWGNWETVSTTYANTLITASQSVDQHVNAPPS